jgi:transcription antitermination factor NusG
MNNWIVASYKLNEVSRLELNLQNQKFDYYLPKIFLEKLNTNLKEELMFPGYIFINTNLNNYSALKYTKGIKKILKFGENVPSMSKDDIDAIIKIEHESKNKPFSTIYTMGQEVVITEGRFKGNLVKICSLPAAKRINILIHVLGSKRKVNIALKDLSL